MDKKIRGYTVEDVLHAECNLEPLICKFCGSDSVIFYQYIGDACCEACGKWQLEGSPHPPLFFKWRVV